MKVIHLIFIDFSDMMSMDVTTPKLTEKGEKAQKVWTKKEMYSWKLMVHGYL
jgi:hypothetical protein